MRERGRYSEALTEQAAELTLYCGQLWAETLAMRPSDARAFFETKAFAGWKKNRENEIKQTAAIIERLDSLGKRIDNLGKALARR